MSLLNFGPTATPAPTAAQPVIPIQITPVVVDNQIRPVSSLRGYVEGMRCVVHWYSQLFDGRMATYGHDTGKSKSLQQFKKINRLEIILDGDITPQQNESDKTFVIQGTAFVTTPGLIPNEGDLFSMDAGDGRVGVMQVNSSERMTALNDAVYQIRFTQVFYGSDARFADLESKVVEQLHYLRDFAQFGKDAIITTSVFNDLKSLAEIRDNLITDYLRSFTHRGHRLFMVPGQTQLTHDPYTARAFRELVSTRDHPEIEQLRFVVHSTDGEHDQSNLWDVLLQRRPDLLIGCRDRAHALSSSDFSRKPVLRSLRYCGADVIVFPHSNSPSMENDYDGSIAWTPDNTVTPGGAVSMLTRKGTPSEVAKNLPPLHPVNHGGFYVLSEAFYSATASGQSLLDKLTWDYLQGEGISSRDLHYLVSNHRAWTAPERYFYVPIVLILIQASLRDAG